VRALVLTLRLVALAGLIALAMGTCWKAVAQAQEGHEHSYETCEWQGADLVVKCMCKCRQRHCDSWMKCNSLPDEAARVNCQREVEKDWERCGGGCTVG
jgi:hypothetical protein